MRLDRTTECKGSKSGGQPMRRQVRERPADHETKASVAARRMVCGDWDRRSKMKPEASMKAKCRGMDQPRRRAAATAAVAAPVTTL